METKKEVFAIPSFQAEQFLTKDSASPATEVLKVRFQILQMSGGNGIAAATPLRQKPQSGGNVIIMVVFDRAPPPTAMFHFY